MRVGILHRLISEIAAQEARSRDRAREIERIERASKERSDVLQAHAQARLNEVGSHQRFLV